MGYRAAKTSENRPAVILSVELVLSAWTVVIRRLTVAIKMIEIVDREWDVRAIAVNASASGTVWTLARV